MFIRQLFAYSNSIKVDQEIFFHAFHNLYDFLGALSIPRQLNTRCCFQICADFLLTNTHKHPCPKLSGITAFNSPLQQKCVGWLRFTCVPIWAEGRLFE